MSRSSRPARLAVMAVVGLGVAVTVGILSVLGDLTSGSGAFKDGEQLVVFENRSAYDLGMAKIRSPQLSWPDYLDLASQERLFAGVVGLTTADRTTWMATRRTRSIGRLFVTRGLLDLLGVKAVLGRLLAEGDFQPGARRAALVTAGLWRGQLGSDPTVVGRTVRVDDAPCTIVGVIDDAVIDGLRPRTAVLERAEDLACLVAPIVPGGGSRSERLWMARSQDRDRPMLTVLGRLRERVSIETARRETGRVMQQIAQQDSGASPRSVDITPFKAWRTRDVRHLLPVLVVVAILAWLAACASAAGLVVADAIRRQPEMAVRSALGASRPRLARLIMWRSLVVVVPGGLLGLGGIAAAMSWVLPSSSNARSMLGPDSVGCAGGLVLFAALLFGVCGSWGLRRADLTGALQEAARTGLPSKRRRIALAGVITLQTVVTVSLAVVCGLLIRSMINVLRVDVGYETGRAFIVRVLFPEGQQTEGGRQLSYLGDALARLRARTDVDVAAFSSTPPLSRVVLTSGGDYLLERPSSPPEALAPLEKVYVSPGYFESLGMRMSRGRPFSEEDARAALPVIVVDEAFCRLHLRGVDPLASGIRMGGTLFRIVGVLRDVRPDGPTADVRATVYALHDAHHGPLSVGHFVIRTRDAVSHDAMDGAVNTLVAIDPTIVIDEPQDLDALMTATLSRRRMVLRALGLAAAAVFLLMAFSISGSLSEFVASRTSELALRKALGATAFDIGRLLGRQVAAPLFAGLVGGAASGVALSSTLASELVGVEATDPVAVMFALGAATFLATVAAIGPLCRATTIDPAVSLRAL